jgi:hypothetical protein
VKIILKCILNILGGGADWIQLSEKGPVADSCGNSNEPLDISKCLVMCLVAEQGLLLRPQLHVVSAYKANCL